MDAQEVKEIREKLKLSQRELADKVGCTSQTISNWETGQKRPHKMFIKRLIELKDGADTEAEA